MQACGAGLLLLMGSGCPRSKVQRRKCTEPSSRMRDSPDSPDRCRSGANPRVSTCVRSRQEPGKAEEGAETGLTGDSITTMTWRPGRLNRSSSRSGQHLKHEYVRELPRILYREKPQIGVLITLETPTQPMGTEAASAGSYQSPWGRSIPRSRFSLLPRSWRETG